MGNGINAGAAVAAAAKAGSSGGGATLIIGLVLVFALLYFVMVRPQRNRQRQIMQTQRQLAPGMRVKTTAGMYATITAVEDADVTLEVAPGVEVRFMRRAIMEVLPDGDAADSVGEPAAEPESAGPGDMPEPKPAENERSAP